MRQRITLTRQLRAYLIQYIGTPPEHLQIHYWYQRILTDPVRAQRLHQLAPEQIQPYIHRQAQRLQRDYIRQQLGLPRLSGSRQRQQLYRKQWQQHYQRSQKFRF